MAIADLEADLRRRREVGGRPAPLGLEPEQRVAIASNTRLDWILADMAVMLAGGATTTVYPSTGDADVAYILGDSNTRFLFAEDESQVEKVRARDELNIEQVVVFDGAGDGDWVISHGRPAGQG